MDQLWRAGFESPYLHQFDAKYLVVGWGIAAQRRTERIHDKVVSVAVNGFTFAR